MLVRRLLGSSWVPMAITAVAIVTLLHRTGVDVGALGRYGLYLALAVALPGVLAWRILLANLHTDTETPPTWFEDLSLGTIFGFAIQLPFYLVGVWVGQPRLFLALPVLVLLITVATPAGRRSWTQPTRRLDVRAAWALALLSLYGVVWLSRAVFVLRPLSLPASQAPSVDETFHHALVSELLHRFPPEIPFLLGTRLDYHWFGHAQLATTMWATDVKFDPLLHRLFPAALLTLTVLGLGAVALRLSGRPVAAVIAPALLLAGGFYLMGPGYNSWTFTESYMTQKLATSPSHTYGFAMALPATMLILEVLRRDRRASPLTWVALLVALLGLSGAKATFVPLFLCGALALWALRLVFWRRFDRTAAGLVVVLVGIAAFAQLVLFGGNTGALGFEPMMTVEMALVRQGILDTTGNRVAMTLALLVGWLLYGAGVFGLGRLRGWRDRRAIWLLCSIPPGVVVGLVLFRSGLSQLWFQRSTVGLVVVLSAWGMASLLPSPLPTRTALRLLAVAAGAGAAAFAAGWLWSSEQGRPDQVMVAELVATAAVPGVLLAAALALAMLSKSGAVRATWLVVVLAATLGLGSANVYGFAYDTISDPAGPRAPKQLFKPGGAQAARWLADHSSPNDIVATNIHCMHPKTDECDNRNFWLSAYSERRVVVEGWGYTVATNESGARSDRISSRVPIPDTRRLAINDAAFDRPSRATISRLVRSYGVSWLFVSKKYPVDLEGLNSLTDVVTRTYRNHYYAIFRVLDPAAR